MDTLLQEPEKDKTINKVLLLGIVVGVIVIAAAIGLLSLKPSVKQVQDQALEGAYREGSPEFEQYTKKIIAETDENRTTESLTGMGTMMMSIGGKIRNITGKTLIGLEIKVSVIDLAGKSIRDKTMTVIPNAATGVDELENNQILPVQVTMEGFDKEDNRANIRWKVTAIKVK